MRRQFGATGGTWPLRRASGPLPRAKLSTEEVLYLATRGGAAVVGLSDKIGGFEVGKEWDAQMIKLDEVPVHSEGAS